MVRQHIIYKQFTSYSRISSLDAMLPFTIFWMIRAWSSSETCSRETRGRKSVGCVFKSSPSQGSAAISSREARLSGSRISIRAISLQTVDMIDNWSVNYETNDRITDLNFKIQTHHIWRRVSFPDKRTPSFNNTNTKCHQWTQSWASSI